MSTYKRICVTNRKLVSGDFLQQIKKITQRGCDAVVLREKDLTEEAYAKTAVEVMKICENNRVQCILHTYADTAVRLGADALHLPAEKLTKLRQEQKACFRILGASVHSAAEAELAYRAGATYLMAGHIFETDCKKGVSPRGLVFLHTVCAAVPIPVYAIGGITPDNAMECMRAGAAGVSMMSAFMRA